MIQPLLYVCVALAATIATVMIAFELQLRAQAYSLRRSTRVPQKGMADLLVYAALIRPGVVLNKDGALMTGWVLRGEDAATKSDAELAQRVAYINAAIAGRDVGWMLHYDKLRVPAISGDEHRYFGSTTQQVLHESRAAAAAVDGARFATRDVLIVTYLPPSDVESRAGNVLVTGRSVRDLDLAPIVAGFDAGLAQIEDALSPIMPGMRRLRERMTVDDRGRDVVFDELLEHLNFCLSGDDDPIIVPALPVQLDELLARDLVGGLKPRVDEKHVRTITIAGFPHESWPTILDRVGALGIPHRFSTRVIVEDERKAREILRRTFADWFGKRTSFAAKILKDAPARVSRDADRMLDDAEEAQAAHDRGLVKYVWYSASIVLIDVNAQKIDGWAREIQKTLRQCGFPSRVETLLAVDAFLGTLPGDGYHNIRKYTLHSLNVGDLLPTTAVWGGRTALSCTMCPPAIGPVAWVKTLGSDYFALDPHADDVMHTFVGGPTGNGKTAFVNFLMANFSKTPHDQVFGIDYQYGQHRTCAMLGGDHYDIAGDSGGLVLCPLKDVDDPDERRWAVDWIESLVELNGIRLTPAHHDRIARAMDLLALSPHRSLTTFAQKLQDPTQELRPALKQYCLGGTLGTLLDGDVDGLGEGRFQVYEMSHLMPLKEKAVVPVLLLLFHRIEQRLRTNSRTLIAIEEAWLYLGHSTFAPRLREWLKTLRKMHAGVVFVTQNLSDVFNSPLCDPILESCKTKILLPNVEAERATTEFYRKVGMTDHQIARIAQATPKRHYWFQAPDGCGMIDLALTPEELAVVGAGSADDIALTRTLQARHPASWQAELFLLRGLDVAADRWRSLDRVDESAPRARELAIA